MAEVLLDCNFTDKTPADRLYEALGIEVGANPQLDFSLNQAYFYSIRNGDSLGLEQIINAQIALELAYQRTFNAPINMV